MRTTKTHGHSDPSNRRGLLRRNDEPECELIAGELISKPMGTLEHMRMERRLTDLLRQFEERGLGEVLCELSLRHGDDVRIPDVVFVPPHARFEDGILIDPPILCVEVLSPSQRLSALMAKCEVYHQWGVLHCWVIDPVGKKAWEYHNGQPLSLVPEDGALNAGDRTISANELFQQPVW